MLRSLIVETSLSIFSLLISNLHALNECFLDSIGRYSKFHPKLGASNSNRSKTCRRCLTLQIEFFLPSSHWPSL